MNSTIVNQSFQQHYKLPSQREIEILELIAFEYTSKEIGDQLFISKETVNTHRKNLMYKLNVKNVAGLVRKAFEVKLLHVSSVA